LYLMLDLAVPIKRVGSWLTKPSCNR
jgi:hypothetical protein